jgi:hypothetical protein
MAMGIWTGRVPIFLQSMWVVAWSVLIIMSVQWVRNVQLTRIWPAVGTICGVGSFLVLVILPIAIFIQILFVLPSVLLAFFLVKFHWAKRH